MTEDGIFFRQRAQEIVELADRLEKNFAVRGKVILQSQGKEFFTWHGKDFFT